MNLISLRALLHSFAVLYLFVSPVQPRSGYTGRDGETGEQGHPGPTGQKGSRGEKGDRGLPGSCGSQVLESVTFTGPTNSVNTDEVRGVLNQLFGTCVEDLLETTTGNQFTIIKGEKGEKGDNGLSIMGEPGLPGVQGPIGPPGVKGERGEMGDMGIKGDKGEKGEKGSEGPIGPVGDTGAPGPVGPAGPTGTPGPKGDRGQDGKTGSGLVYIRWGKSSCPPNSVLLHEGIVTQAATTLTNLLCIPKYSTSTTHGHQHATPPFHITRMEPLLYTDRRGVVDAIPCARCYDSSHLADFTFPGSKTCPTGWTRQYHGHLITSYEFSTTDVLCGDEWLTREIQWRKRRHGYRTSYRRNNLNMIETVCGKGVMSCRGYNAGQLMPCALCSK